MKITWPNLTKLDLTYGPKMSTIVCIFNFFPMWRLLLLRWTPLHYINLHGCHTGKAK